MDRQNYIKMLIKSENLTMKDFAQKVNIPYTTLLSILNGSLGGASVDNVMKICAGLHITIESLQQSLNDTDLNISLETELIRAFRMLNTDYKNIALHQIKVLAEYQISSK